jgi:hypothetical protein
MARALPSPRRCRDFACRAGEALGEPTVSHSLVDRDELVLFAKIFSEVEPRPTKLARFHSGDGDLLFGEKE